MQIAYPLRALSFFLLGALAATAHVAQRWALAARSKWPTIEEHVWAPSPRAARFFSLGYNELLADMLWARTLVYYGDGLSENSSLTDIEPLLRAINWLDPHFRRPYQWGAYALMFRQREDLASLMSS